MERLPEGKSQCQDWADLENIEPVFSRAGNKSVASLGDSNALDGLLGTRPTIFLFRPTESTLALFESWSGRGMARSVCIWTLSVPRRSGRAFGGSRILIIVL